MSGIAGWQAAGQATVAIWGSYQLGQIQRARGRLDAAALTCQQALQVAAGSGSTPLQASGPVHVGLAEVAYQRNELDLALGHVTEGIALCRQFVYTPPLAAGLVTLAWIRQATGSEGRPGWIGEAGGHTGAVNGGQRARLLLARGDIAGAARWTQENGLAADDEPDYPREPGHLVLARSCSPKAGPARH